MSSNHCELVLSNTHENCDLLEGLQNEEERRRTRGGKVGYFGGIPGPRLGSGPGPKVTVVVDRKGRHVLKTDRRVCSVIRISEERFSII
jgi:hypothetical protein